MSDQTVTIKLKLTKDGNAVAEATAELQRLAAQGKTTGDQVADAMKKSEAASDGAAKKFENMGGVIGKAAAGAITAFAGLIGYQVKLAAEIDTTSKRIGASAEEISSLGAAAKRNDADLDKLVSGLDSLAEAAGRAASGAGAGAKLVSAEFSAIGVSVTDANGKIKPTVQLFEEVSKSLSKLPEGALKAKLAAGLLGGEGKNLNATMQELASKGLKGVEEQAAKTGHILSTDAARSAHELTDKIEELRGKVGAWASSVAQDAVPAALAFVDVMLDGADAEDKVGQKSTLLRDVIQGVGLVFLYAGEVIRGVFTYIYAGVDILMGLSDAATRAAGGIGKAAQSLFEFGKGNFAAADALGKQAQAAFKGSWTDVSNRVKTAMDNINQGAIESTKKIAEYQKKIEEANKGLAKGADNGAASMEEQRKKAAANAAALARYKQAILDAQQANDNSAERLLDNLHKQVATFGQSGVAGARYEVSITKMTEAQRKEALQIVALLEEWEKYGKVVKEAADAQQKLTDQATSIAEQSLELEDRIGGADDAQVEFNKTLREAQSEMEKIMVLGPPSADAQKAYADTIAAAQRVMEDTRAYDIQKQAMEEQKQALQEQERFWTSFADTIAQSMTRGGNLVRNLGAGIVAALRNMVQQMLATGIMGIFARLFGLGGGTAGAGLGGLALSGAAFAGTGGGGGSGLYSSASGGVINAAAGQGSSLLSPTTWVSFGKNLWNGFVGGANSTPGGIGSSLFGTSIGDNFVGPLGPGQSYGYTPSALGYGAGALGGIYAGVNRYKSGGGILGGLSYGIGTAGLIGGVGSLLAGGTFGAGLAGGLGAGAAAGAGFTGLASAIPFIGWAALIAMVVDKVAGGKLFGTSYQTNASTTSFGIGPDGGDATAYLSQSKQKALFGGRKFRTVSTDAGSEADAAAQQLFDNVKQTMVAAANAIKVEVPPVIKASLDVVNEYDKKGKVTSTKIFVEALGRKWEEASQELAATRISAEAIVATVAASEAGKAASAIAEQWRSSADKLMEGAQFLVAATGDIVHGYNLLGDGGTLGDIASIVAKLAQSGETLSQTYARLREETDMLKEALDLSGVSLGKTGADLVQFADDLTKAAGGADKAQALWQSFFNSFYSQQELAQRQLGQLQKSSADQLSALGLDPNIGKGDFRAKFETALPTLTPEQVAQWLAAGAALGAFTDAAEQFKAAIEKANADYTASVRALDLELGNTSGLSNTLADIRQWARDATAQLNDLAKAGGRAGASQSDLAKIEQVAAQRMAAAIAQLQNSSLDIAAKLGYVDTLDSLNAKIAALQQSAGAASDSVSGAADAFGAANDKLNLMIGDLSPYSDNKKLDLALEGLKAGTVSADQVLQIGRRLYASGNDYDKLFEQVLKIGGGRSVGGGGGSGGGASGAQVNAAEIAELTRRRDELAAAERKNEAKQLAQNIADLAQSQKISVQEVADGLGIHLEDLAKDLGLDQSKVAGFIESLEKQDVAAAVTDGTGGIVDAVQAASADIVAAIRGTTFNAPTNAQPGVAPAPSAPGPAPGGDGTAPPDPVRDKQHAEAMAMQGRIAAALDAIAANTGENVDAAKQTLRVIGDGSLIATAQRTR